MTPCPASGREVRCACDTLICEAWGIKSLGSENQCADWFLIMLLPSLAFHYPSTLQRFPIPSNPHGNSASPGKSMGPAGAAAQAQRRPRPLAARRPASLDDDSQGDGAEGGDPSVGRRPVTKRGRVVSFPCDPYGHYQGGYEMS